MHNNQVLGRPPSPSRAEAIQMALRSQVVPKYNNGVLIGLLIYLVVKFGGRVHTDQGQCGHNTYLMGNRKV